MHAGALLNRLQGTMRNRNARSWVLWACLILTTPTTATQTPPQGAPEAPRAAYELPQPISSGDLERWAQWLLLAPEQRAIADQWLGEYRQQWSDEARKTFAELEDYSRRVGQLAISPGQSQLFATERSKMHRRVMDVEDSLLKLDEQLFGQLNSILAEPQLAAASRAKAARQRDVSRLRSTEIRGASIDLSVLVNGCGLEPGHLQAIEPIISEYETQCTTAFVELKRQRDRNRTRLIELEARLALSPDEAIAKTILDERSTILIAEVRDMRRIADLNAQCLDRLSGVLPERAAATVRGKYNELVYSRLYPDTTNPRALVQEIQLDAQAPPETQDALAALLDAHRAEYVKIDGSLRKVQDEWNERFASTFSAGGMNEYKAVTADLMNQRIACNLRLLSKSEALLPPEVALAYAERIKTYHQMISRQAGQRRH